MGYINMEDNVLGLGSVGFQEPVETPSREVQLVAEYMKMNQNVLSDSQDN